MNEDTDNKRTTARQRLAQVNHDEIPVHSRSTV
jgi:hypothetical protein